MADGLLTMFGKTYNTVGSADSNLVLLTRGDLKIRWGNKFIDLIKNGKVNVDVDILSKVDDKDTIIKDGLYLIENGDTPEVWIRIGGKVINLVGEIGKTYVSFVEALDVDADGRFMALSNAGFYYDSLETAKARNLTKGLVYIVAENQLYYIKDGQYLKYEPSLNVPNPLVVGNVTIDGNTSSIQGNAELHFNVGTNNYMSLIDNGINMKHDVIVHLHLQSYDYVGQSKGFIIMDTETGDSYAEFDIIKIRKKIEYTNREYYTYIQLKDKKEKEQLIEGREYVITDFLNEWEVTVPNETYLKNDPEHKPNVWPIVIIAKNKSEFEKEGFFEDRPDWIIEYDFDYYYYLRSYDATNVNGSRIKEFLYTKGKITKLTDQKGNICNYDFKHRKFKYTESSDDKTKWYYTFSVSNPYYNSLLNIKLDKENKFLDATELEEVSKFATTLKNVKVKNNIINILNPDIKRVTVLDGNGNDVLVDKAFVYDYYILFPNCQIFFPYNNQILESQGRYVITHNFHDNEIEALLQNVVDKLTFYFNFSFYNNVCGKMYIWGDDLEGEVPISSSKKITFTANNSYYGNVMGKVINTLFMRKFNRNICDDIENVVFEGITEDNTFVERLFEVRFGSVKLLNNQFLGKIDTDSEETSHREIYPIKGEIFLNNIINNITKVKIEGKIENNKFNDLKPTEDGTLTLIKCDIKDCVIKDLIGVEFKPDISIEYVRGYNEEYNIEYDIEKAIIEKDINKLIFKGKIFNIDFKDEISNVNILGETGTSEFRTKFGKISDTTFYTNIIKLDAETSEIENCKFNGEVEWAKIRGTLTNCSFMKLSENIEIGLANDSVEDTTILINIEPTSSEWVLDEENPSKLIRCSPLKINKTAVPRLKVKAHKECFILVINPDEKKTFVVQLSTDDTNPSGIILMWSGSIASIPKGYVICDGGTYNGVTTPDLRGRFIRMVSKSGNSWESTGLKNNTDLVQGTNGNNYLSGNKVPKHTHTFKSYNQTFYSDASALNINYVGSHSLLADLTGKSASISYYLMDTNYGTSIGKFTTSESGTSIGKYSSTATATLTGSAPVTGSLPAIEATGNISITISFTPELDDESFPEKTNIEPLAYALIFIMKL